jgi:hypothetical protein
MYHPHKILDLINKASLCPADVLLHCGPSFYYINQQRKLFLFSILTPTSAHRQMPHVGLVMRFGKQ